jgi:hypothetical protein
MTAHPAWHAQVLPMIERGMTILQIAHDLGKRYKAVDILCRRRGWKPVRCPPGRRLRKATDYSVSVTDFDDLVDP